MSFYLVINQALKKLNQNVISVTRNTTSSLAKLSKVHIKAYVVYEGDSFNKPPRLSIIVEMLALQLLSLKLQSEIKLDLNTYKLYHPAGSIGQSLKNTIERIKYATRNN